MFNLSEGDTGRLLTQATALHAAIDLEMKGDSSAWDYSTLNYFRQDSQAAAMLRDAKAALNNGALRMDDSLNAGGFLPEALTYYDPEFVEEEYEATLYADPGFLNIRQLNRPGVRTIKVQSVDRVGRFKVSSDRNTQTEALDAGMRDTDFPTEYIAAHVEYTSRELDAMAEAQAQQNVFGFLNLVQYKMTNVVQAAYREEMNRINSVGISSLGIYGLHTFYGLPRAVSPVALTESSTPEQFVSVFDRGIRQFLANTGEKYRPDAVMMTIDMQETMSSRMIGTSNMSLLEWVMKQKGLRAVYTTPEMKTAVSSGPFIHFLRMSDNNQAVVTKGLTQDGMPYRSGGATRVDYNAAIGGVICKKPFEHLIYEAVGI